VVFAGLVITTWPSSWSDIWPAYQRTYARYLGSGVSNVLLSIVLKQAHRADTPANSEHGLVHWYLGSRWGKLSVPVWITLLPAVLTHCLPMLVAYGWLLVLAAAGLYLVVRLVLCLCLACCRRRSLVVWGPPFVQVALLLVVCMCLQTLFAYGVLLYGGHEVSYLGVPERDWRLRNTACYVRRLASDAWTLVLLLSAL